MRRSVLITYQGLPDLSIGDRLVLPLLQRAGVEAVAVAWDNRSARWDAFDALILRSCWDYHLRRGEFSAWLRQIEERQIRLWNPLALEHGQALPARP